MFKIITLAGVMLVREFVKISRGSSIKQFTEDLLKKCSGF